MTRQIIIVGFNGCQPLDLVGPLEVFAGAQEVRKQCGAPGPGYVLTVAGENNELHAPSGLCIRAQATLSSIASPRWSPIDTLIIAGGEGARRAARQPKIVKLVQRAVKRSRRVASVCTGAFVLAAAGLLDGRRATTHWEFCDELAKTYPRVRVERDPIYVHDGPFWTSAGVTAGVDLALALVEKDLGHQVAMHVARQLVVFVRRAGGQSQFSTQLAAQAAQREPIRELQAWIEEHPDKALDLPSLARRVFMSVRHFGRVFRAQVGVSPAAYVERVRVEIARRLLENTTQSVEQIAAASGFGSPEVLRRALARHLGLSPREYRARFAVNSIFPGETQ